MTDWHAVTTLSDLRARKKKAVEVAGTAVALFYINDVVYALADTCIHEQRQLSKGALLFGKVICPGHQWKFDPETGEAEGQDGCQPTYAVKVDDDGMVHVSTARARADA
ncbi:Rieske 2Fe-2S domain-containing protein [Nocardioides sp. zg-DK7169]|uniref:Rieske (2Fe-2S) protein n=1 Tax=Nocardioides sp. zg-DK7169 TaxID=2736600 RepID=UPI001554EB28|nr:Rieske 2Fe-2S domain-containing protein [Nocardioides sp. zg-DK7169]NPC96838.1 Rieske 2Fe-2S domain-containing protein [Nocardioides sp. zg-DK7169]